jgi:MFS family permease
MPANSRFRANYFSSRASSDKIKFSFHSLSIVRFVIMKHVIPLVYVTSFLFLFGESIQLAPRIAIYESIVCKQYYAGSRQNGPLDCKIPPVQQELAFLSGIERLSIIVPSILAIPFAALADRWGHSLILSLALFGVFLEDGWPFIVCWFPQLFPVRWIWLHFVFSLLGGGFTVIVTLLHVIIANVVSPEERTKIFFRARAAGVGATFLGFATSGLTMKVNSWLPWAIGLGNLCLATATARIIPRTTAQDQDQNQGNGNDSDCNAFTDTLGMRIIASAKALWHTAKMLVCNKQVAIMLFIVFLCQLGFDSVPLMMAIYVSKRFHWSFADVSNHWSQKSFEV